MVRLPRLRLPGRRRPEPEPAPEPEPRPKPPEYFEIPVETLRYYHREGYPTNVVITEFNKLLRRKLGRRLRRERMLCSSALGFAFHHHAGQERWSGAHYIEHPLEVTKACLERGGNYEHATVALLHDVVEDAPPSRKQTIRQEIREYFGDEILRSVDTLTRNPGETYDAYLYRVLNSGDLTAIWVKVQDALHNLQTLGYLPRQQQQKELTKYRVLYNVATRIDPKTAQAIGRIIKEFGGEVSEEGRGRYGRVIVAPSLLTPNYLPTLFTLPRAETQRAVVFKPVERMHLVDVDVPVARDVEESDWLKLLRKVEGISKVSARPTELPLLAGASAHLRVELRAGNDHEWLVERIRDAHERLFPEWKPS